MPAVASDMPARKAGLWEIKTTTPDGHGIAVRQCIDARTDQAMQSASSMAQHRCSRGDVQKTGDTMTVDTVCTVAGKTVKQHSVITGSFDSGYTMTVTSQGLPAEQTITIAAKWLGDCAAGQRPGDMIMPNGMKMNILDMQKNMQQHGPPGAFGAPSR